MPASKRSKKSKRAKNSATQLRKSQRLKNKRKNKKSTSNNNASTPATNNNSLPDRRKLRTIGKIQANYKYRSKRFLKNELIKDNTFYFNEKSANKEYCYYINPGKLKGAATTGICGPETLVAIQMYLCEGILRFRGGKKRDAFEKECKLFYDAYCAACNYNEEGWSNSSGIS